MLPLLLLPFSVGCKWESLWANSRRRHSWFTVKFKHSCDKSRTKTQKGKKEEKGKEAQKRKEKEKEIIQ